MGCRGVHFAINRDMMEKLLSAKSDKDLVWIVQEDIEEEWNEIWLRETDKAWDAIHRCLTDGKLGHDNGTFPLNACILGGEQLYKGDDYIISLIRPEKVKAVADALQTITKDIFRSSYFRIEQPDYDGEVSEEDFEYTWEYFVDLPELFTQAVENGRAIIFTVDQ